MQNTKHYMVLICHMRANAVHYGVTVFSTWIVKLLININYLKLHAKLL